MDILQSEDRFYMYMESKFKRIPIEALNKELLIALNELAFFHIYKYIFKYNDYFLDGIDVYDPFIVGFDQLNWFIFTHDRLFKSE
jgi:hypothetical protein